MNNEGAYYHINLIQSPQKVLGYAELNYARPIGRDAMYGAIQGTFVVMSNLSHLTRREIWIEYREWEEANA